MKPVIQISSAFGGMPLFVTVIEDKGSNKESETKCIFSIFNVKSLFHQNNIQ